MGELSPPAACGRQGNVRLARLDGLRGIAACVVAVYHAQGLYAGGLADAYGGLAGWVYAWGWTLVDLFFVISGYIFAHVYLGGRALANGRQLADFAVARVARLYPLHLVMLLLVAAFAWGQPENTLGAFFAHLLMLQGLVPGAGEAFVSASWSISIEMLCYALFALAALSGERTLARVSLALVALAGLQLALNGLPGGPWNADDIPRGLLGFFIGQVLWRHREALRRLPAAALALVFAGGLAIDAGRFSSLLPLALLAWPAALLLALRLALFEARPLLWLGDRSYAIYLIHLPVIHVFGSLLGPLDLQAVHPLGVHLAVAAVVLVLSDLALRLIERPGRDAIRQAGAKRQSAVSAGRLLPRR